MKFVPEKDLGSGHLSHEFRGRGVARGVATRLGSGRYRKWNSGTGM